MDWKFWAQWLLSGGWCALFLACYVWWQVRRTVKREVVRLLRFEVVQRLRLEDGDMVVLSTERMMTEKEIGLTMEIIEQVFPGRRGLILSNGLRMEVAADVDGGDDGGCGDA